MELNYLKVFYEVAKSGKFAIAAKKLNISQSALSRSVSLLEEDQGVILFDRSKEGVSLTEKGEQIFRLCEKLFQIEKEIESTCKEISVECSGILKVATQDHTFNNYILNSLDSFKKNYPNLQLQFIGGSPDEMINLVLAQKVEFALLFSKVVTPQIEYKKIDEIKMSLVCSTELWKKNRSSDNHKTIDNILTKYGYISSIDAALTQRGAYLLTELFGKIPKIAIEVNSQESQKKLAISSHGIAYLAHFMVKEEIQSGVLYEIPIYHENVLNLWFAKLKHQSLSLNSKTFLREILGFKI